MKKLHQLILTLTLLAPSIFAELEWKNTSLTRQVHPLQAAVMFDFAFTNSGVESISISDLRPGCGCISMRTDKKVYAPGESGGVEVTFKLDKRKGYQRKRIEVRTGGPSGESIYLYVSTAIPQTYAPSVKRLEWSKGEERTAKSCRILNTHKNPYRLLKAESLKDGLKVELKPIREGYEYELVIHPSTGLSKGLIPIKIYPEIPEELDKVKVYTVYALFK